MSLHKAVIDIGRALAIDSKERYGRNGRVMLEVKQVQILYDDWRRLDGIVRANERMLKQEKEEND